MEQLNRRIRAWLWPPDLPAVLWRRNLLIVARFVYALVRELASGELSLRDEFSVYHHARDCAVVGVELLDSEGPRLPPASGTSATERPRTPWPTQRGT